ncbi:zinc finger binding domain [Mycobacterium phage Tonenili]|uniref:Zinc finger binding domain protein n=1 Tax=Mycobacterium phage Tonenili TaxID=1891703 RepID=A0A1C9EH96_9CAUD|nr:zinc finger binding domain [Mycobacterium phage Tonenili]AON96861.1 zinc finger binding domain protein [Mycobacterium phage Tonenili]
MAGFLLSLIDVKGWLRPESEVKCREAGVRLITKADLLRLESGDSLDAHRMLLWNPVTAS